MQRIRTKDNRSYSNITLAVDTLDRFNSCTAPLAWRNVGNQSWNSFPSGRLRTMSDVVSPQFKTRVAKGEVFFNPCTSITIDIKAEDGGSGEIQKVASTCAAPNSYFQKSRYVVNGSLGLLTSGFNFNVDERGFLIAPDSTLNPNDTSSLRTEVATSCLNQIGRGDSNLWESLAEADKLVGLLPGIFHNGLKVARSATFQAKAKGVGSAYLALRYGLQPVLNDVASVMLGLQAITGKIRKTYRAKGSINRSSTVTNPSYVWGGGFNCEQKFLHTESLEIRAMSLCEFYASVMSNIGLTSKGLLTLPWELLPYSFVIDWFANVGDLLGALVPNAGVTQLGSCLVEKREHTTFYTLTSKSSYVTGFNISQPVYGACRRQVTVYSRSVDPLSPGLIIKSDFRFQNLTRSADALALLIGALR